MPELTNLGHIDRALTNMSVGYMQGADAFIADKVFPKIPVQKQSDVYYEYSKADFFRNEVQERGRAAESAGGQFNVKLADPYHCRKFAFHYDITEEERVNYDKPLNAELDATSWLGQKMLLKREMDFANKFFKTGIWNGGVDYVADGNTKKRWDDPLADPVGVINDAAVAMAENTGKKPNFIIMAPDVYNKLRNHDSIMDRIKYTQKGIITKDLIASLFEVDEIHIPWAIYNAGPTTPGYDTTKNDMKFMYKGQMLLGYKASRPSLKEPSAGYIFTWAGLEGADAAYGSRMIRLKMDMLGLGTERFEMEMAYDQKLICSDVGMFFSSLITP